MPERLWRGKGTQMHTLTPNCFVCVLQVVCAAVVSVGEDVVVGFVPSLAEVPARTQTER